MTTKAIVEYDGTTLADNEQIIERGQKSFVEVGAALMRIRDGNLYPGAGKRGKGATFETYCRDRWSMGADYARKLIESASTVSLINTTVSTKPANERQVRPLLKLPEADRAEAWLLAEDKAKENGGTITAKKVQEAVEEIKGGIKIVATHATLADLSADMKKAVDRILGKCAESDRAILLRSLVRIAEGKLNEYEND